MRIYIPQTLTLDASNVAASTLAAWASGTTYAKHSEETPVQVQYQEEGSTIVREYESLQAANTGHPPAEGGTAWWLDLGPCNRDEMFDGHNNSRTVADSGDDRIQVKITPPGRAQYLALLGLRNIYEVVISLYDTPSGTVPLAQLGYWTVQSMHEIGWWDWLFGSHYYRRSLIIPLPGMYYRPCVQVDLIGGLAECGQCFFCAPYDLGCTADGASPALLSYSTFQADEFGVVKYVQRQNTRELNMTLWTQTSEFDRIYGLLERHESDLVLLDANHQEGADATDLDALRVYGKLTSIRPGLAYDRTPIELRIQGLD